eukprot:CAMPEP_0172623296 /NCGR_PEP_ID=MMETSP1068-20121228/127328_1 /TAXON_ID=35684 /ORGANISM="Pseudopedinella elastica, Strain CCMP716" /LENGTH=283 /DNA_ID=CAMNT_0013431803 /DNA_START=52 /DNA_END=903 /DNA_ORIENTATION=+
MTKRKKRKRGAKNNEEAPEVEEAEEEEEEDSQDEEDVPEEELWRGRSTAPNVSFLGRFVSRLERSNAKAMVSPNSDTLRRVGDHKEGAALIQRIANLYGLKVHIEEAVGASLSAGQDARSLILESASANQRTSAAAPETTGVRRETAASEDAPNKTIEDQMKGVKRQVDPPQAAAARLRGLSTGGVSGALFRRALGPTSLTSKATAHVGPVPASTLKNSPSEKVSVSKGGFSKPGTLPSQAAPDQPAAAAPTTAPNPVVSKNPKSRGQRNLFSAALSQVTRTR